MSRMKDFVGGNISKEEFEYWFKTFLLFEVNQRVYYGDKKITNKLSEEDCSNILLNDKTVKYCQQMLERQMTQQEEYTIRNLLYQIVTSYKLKTDLRDVKHTDCSMICNNCLDCVFCPTCRNCVLEIAKQKEIVRDNKSVVNQSIHIVLKTEDKGGR